MRLTATVVSGFIALAAASCVQAQDGHRLVLTGVGRFAVFADLASIRPDGDGVRMRSFQAAEADFHVGDQAYWGGWSGWRYDCRARTADRLDFAAVKAGGAEGPATPDRSGPYDAAPGGDAAELLAVACDPVSAGEADADSLAAAVRLGRAQLGA
jgi:hypothetical protein